MKTQIAILVTGLLFVGQLVMAEGQAGGACGAYAEACKADSKVAAATEKQKHYTAMHKCIKKAAVADAAKGKDCLAWMESHHDHAPHDGGDTEKK